MNAARVVTLGEALLRLTPPGAGLLRTAQELEVHVGGSEANVAAGLATLGLRATWLSRVSDAPTGDLVLGELARRGVDTASVTRDTARTGTYYLEEGRGVRPSRAVYDRERSAFTRLRPEHLPEAAFDDARAFHTTGISLAVADAPLAAVRAAWDHAGGRGLLRSFDLNLRSTLIRPQALGEAAAPYLFDCDLAFVAERDARAVWGLPDADLDDVFAALREACPRAVLVVTRGAEGARAAHPDGRVFDRAALATDGPGRIGRGDAFAAGFLAAYLEDPEPAAPALPTALAWGVAAASYKVTQPGDLPLLDRDAVASLAEGVRDDGVRR